MANFGWSLPPGCSSLPGDEVPDPSPESEQVYDLLEGLVDQNIIDQICQIVDNLAWKADHCPTCERIRCEAEAADWKETKALRGEEE